MLNEGPGLEVGKNFPFRPCGPVGRGTGLLLRRPPAALEILGGKFSRGVRGISELCRMTPNKLLRARVRIV